MKRMFGLLVVFAVACVIAGCSDDEKVCSPGVTQTCVCPGDKSGAQTCEKDGKSWNKCEGCSTSADGGTDAFLVDQKVVPDQVVPDQVVPDQQVPDQLVSDQLVSDQLVADQLVPDQLVADQQVPDQLVVDQLVPDYAVPDQTTAPDQAVVPGTWVTINAGTFQMGSPSSESCRSNDETQHQVTLTHKFEIQSTEVTQAQFTSLMGYNPSKFTSCGINCPLEQVNWYEAAAYANALSAQVGKAKCYKCTGSGKSVSCTEATAYAGKKVYTCPGYRLPTEAEWEYAYRAGTSTAFYNGGITSCKGKDPNLEKIGWYNQNSSSTTHPVGQKTPNTWGLYDMAGNVWEWCHDWYGSYPSSSVSDPVGPTGSSRVLRGGSWYGNPDYVRAAYRNAYTPSSRLDLIGFRCTRTIK